MESFEVKDVLSPLSCILKRLFIDSHIILIILIIVFVALAFVLLSIMRSPFALLLTFADREFRKDIDLLKTVLSVLGVLIFVWVMILYSMV